MREAGAPTFPARSTARTSNVWAPALTRVRVCGATQVSNAAVSSQALERPGFAPRELERLRVDGLQRALAWPRGDVERRHRSDGVDDELSRLRCQAAIGVVHAGDPDAVLALGERRRRVGDTQSTSGPSSTLQRNVVPATGLEKRDRRPCVVRELGRLRRRSSTARSRRTGRWPSTTRRRRGRSRGTCCRSGSDTCRSNRRTASPGSGVAVRDRSSPTLAACWTSRCEPGIVVTVALFGSPDRDERDAREVRGPAHVHSLIVDLPAVR